MVRVVDLRSREMRPACACRSLTQLLENELQAQEDKL
jgi:hypothetical protein